MGRHSSRASGPYLRSVLAWAFPWILIAAAVIATVWFVVTAVGGRDIVDGRPSSNTSTPRADSPPESPTPTPEPTRSRRNPARPASPKGDPDGLITKGITVQVVNATGGVEGAAAEMANQLASLGYTVESIVTGLTTDQTAVYWSAESSRAAAEALADHFGWLSGPAPASLTTAVDVHVVVAPDALGA